MAAEQAPVAGPTLGLDLGGSAIKWVLLEGDEVVADGTIPTPTGGTGAVVDAMVAITEAHDGFDALGVGVPGLFTREGVTTLIPNVPGRWDGFPLVDRLRSRVQRPTVLANDGRAFTLAELRLGAGKAFQHLIGMVIGTGIGGGIALSGRIHQGQDGAAGEVGHQFVDAAGPRCGCGAMGCLEVFASAPAIRAGGARAVWQGVDTSLRERCGDDVGALTAEMVLDAARDGDPYAADVARRAGRALGIGLSNLCNVLAPQVVVFGGGVAAGLDVLHPAITEVLDDRSRLGDHPELVRANLGPATGALGAALWARERPDLEVTR